MYKISREIIAEVEVFIVANGKIPKCFDWAIRGIAFPFGLVMVGATIGLKESLKLFVVCLSLALFWFWITSDLPLLSSQHFIAVLGISVFPLLFSSPSAYCHFGVDLSYVEKVVEIFINKGIKPGEPLTPIRSNIEIFENRVKQRVLFLRGILALWWAGFLFIATKYADKFLMVKVQGSSIDIGWIVLFIFFLLLGYVAIEGYSKGTSLLFKTIHFGLNELEACKEEVPGVSLGMGSDQIPGESPLDK